jgi:hypothetical protein
LTDGDCANGQVCSPNILIAEIGGQLECVDPGSEADGESCDLLASGQECASTHCASADIMGLLQLGVCSECSNVDVPNEGCAAGETCVDPTVELDGAVTAGSCV